jgi:hypothetical protein
VVQSYRNGGEILVEWKRWKENVWQLCPFGTLDRTRCSAPLCPCDLLQVNHWINKISGYLGPVKMVKYFHARDGNGRGNGTDEA